MPRNIPVRNDAHNAEAGGRALLREFSHSYQHVQAGFCADEQEFQVKYE